MDEYEEMEDFTPLFLRQNELNKAQVETPLILDRKRVVSGVFDAYKSNVIAPDHLLTGLENTVIELSLQVSILMGLDQDLVDVHLCHTLRMKGLLTENTVLNSKGQQNSTRLSGKYALLLVYGPLSRNYGMGRNLQNWILLYVYKS